LLGQGRVPLPRAGVRGFWLANTGAVALSLTTA